jgi:TonB family protein
MILTTPRKPRGNASEPQHRDLVLHLPERKRPGVMDLSLTGAVLLLAGLSVHLAVLLPSPKAPVEETLDMIEEAPPPRPPEEIKEPPKPPEPPPERTPPPEAKTEAPPPVFGLQEDEASESGDMATAMGNTLAAKPDSVVRESPAPLYAAPVELDHPPGFLKQVVAAYPEWAQEQGVEAKVLVWVTIDAEGRVTEASLKRGAGKDFDAGALTAARASLFQPLVRNGAKVPSRFVVAYDFKLEG